MRFVVIAGVLLTALFALLIVGMFAAVLGTPTQAAGYEPSGHAQGDIPPVMLKLYIETGEREGIDWAVLAGVGWRETKHGQGGCPTSSAGARGPMQFMPGTWEGYGEGGDICDPRDAIPAAARLLKANGAPGDYRRALYAYNHAWWYVDEVLEQAAKYRGGIEGGQRVSSESVDAVLSNARITLTPLQRSDLRTGQIDQRIVTLLGWIGRRHTVTVTSLKSDHSFLTDSGHPSNHASGRAMDIAVVDGVSCHGTMKEPCGQLGLELAAVEGAERSTELIWCSDLDGVYDSRAFAAADHCDHLHVGFGA